MCQQARVTIHPQPSRSVFGHSGAQGVFVLSAVLAYLATFAFEGPLRFALNGVGAGSALYLRDAVAAAVIAMALFHSVLVDNRIPYRLLLSVSILVMHGAIGLIGGLEPMRVALGLKVFLPFLFGMAAFPFIAHLERAFGRGMLLMLLASVAGIGVNSLIGQMPWEGMPYDTGFGKVVETTKLWWMGEAARLPGFARTSYDAASVTGLTAMMVLCRYGSVPATLLIGAITIVGIHLTTSRGMLLSIAVFLPWQLLQKPGQPPRYPVLYLVLALFALLLPTVVILFDLGTAAQLRRAPDWMFSILDRFGDMWPRAMELFSGPLAALIGEGPGALGFAQSMSDVAEGRLNAGDNIFVYCFVTFGLSGIVYVASFPFFVRSVCRSMDDWARIRAGITIMTFSYGLTTNIIESAFFLFLVGLALSSALEMRRIDAEQRAGPRLGGSLARDPLVRGQLARDQLARGQLARGPLARGQLARDVRSSPRFPAAE